MLECDPKRQATDSIRGYVYQIYQSVLAWMKLADDEVLVLEGAEDFDVHAGTLVTTTQVKDTAGAGAVTLRNPDVVKAINNFWTHKESNRENQIQFRFLTTLRLG